MTQNQIPVKIPNRVQLRSHRSQERRLHFQTTSNEADLMTLY